MSKQQQSSQPQTQNQSPSQEQKKISPEKTAGKLFTENFVKGAGWQLGTLAVSVAVGTVLGLALKATKKPGNPAP